MLHGTTPWVAKNEYQLIQNISTIPLTFKRSDLKPATVDFIKRCLALEEEKRISWDELFLHPIFNGFFDNKAINKTFENKLKQIMGELRFYISSNNLDLVKILYNLGYSN
jgi:serine/threonine protein kinase